MQESKKGVKKMLDELKQQVYEANMELPAKGLVTYTWGNVSGIDRERGLFVIKPSGVDYEKLTPDEINGEYEKKTGIVIAETFDGKNPIYVPGVLCTNHGPFSWGADAAEAVHNAVVMEEVAKMAYRCEHLKKDIEEAPQVLQDKHFFRKHGENAYYGNDL